MGCACLNISLCVPVCVCVEEGGGFRTDRKFRFLNSSRCMLLRCSKSASHFAVFTFPLLPSACLVHLLDVGKGVLYRRAGSYNIRISDSTLRNSRCGVWLYSSGVPKSEWSYGQTLTSAIDGNLKYIWLLTRLSLHRSATWKPHKRSCHVSRR
jgi:hypothetical protein